MSNFRDELRKTYKPIHATIRPNPTLVSKLAYEYVESIKTGMRWSGPYWNNKITKEANVYFHIIEKDFSAHYDEVGGFSNSSDFHIAGIREDVLLFLKLVIEYCRQNDIIFYLREKILSDSNIFKKLIGPVTLHKAEDILQFALTRHSYEFACYFEIEL